VHLTRVDDESAPIVCDTFMPAIDARHFDLVHATPPLEEAGYRYAYLTYRRRH